MEFLAIVGSTASGKTEWGLRLAQEDGSEIISVDSRQIYRFLSVGTAKPEGRWLGGNYEVSGIPYHLVDILNPDQPFSAAGFVELAEEKIQDIVRRGKKPILVGGTGLYLKALLQGLAPMPPRDEALRAALRDLAEKRGRPHLHRELARVDPEAASRIPANNIARVTRALEVFKLTGKPISQWHRDHQKASLASPPSDNGRMAGRATAEERRWKVIGLDPGKKVLHENIERRCRRMLEEGLIEETKTLLGRNYPENCPALSGLGYPRVISFLHGKISKDELLLLLAQDTRQYAKRQMTWFRNQMEVEWSTFAKATGDHPPTPLGPWRPPKNQWRKRPEAA